MSETPAEADIIRFHARKLLDRAVGSVERVMSSIRHGMVDQVVRPSSLYNSKNSQVVFPENTKFFWQNDYMAQLIMEDKPQMRTVSYGRRKYHISLPYFYYLLQVEKGELRRGNTHWYFTHMWVGLRTTPLETVEDSYYDVPLPNVNNHSVCMGSMSTRGYASLHSLATRAKAHFWNSTFNDGMGTMEGLHKVFPSMEEWRDKSAKDPAFVFKKIWGPARKLNDFCAVTQSEDQTNLIHWLDRVCSRTARQITTSISSDDIAATLQVAVTDIMATKQAQPKSKKTKK